MSILNVGTQALQSNLIALQTTGNNIANANVTGYSRQRAVMETVPGQYTGAGFIGKGVSVQTIQRNYDAYLNRQANTAAAAKSSDALRSDYLSQLGNLFQGGSDGLGAAINDMMNAFSDVATAPTDLTARTVALTRVDETARRMRSASQSLDDLQNGITQSLKEKVAAVNNIAGSIADMNQQISKAMGTGQPPNDLLDRRDQLIRDMNRYVQTTSVPADDGSIGIFLAGSQPLVLGTTVAPLAVATDDFADPLKNKIALTRNGSSTTLDENLLGGGEISGLLKFQNNDLVEGRNLLGRLTLAVTTAMNDQHKLGLDLDGKVGGNIFTQTTFDSNNILTPAAPAKLNTGNATLTLAVADTGKFAASDYAINFDSPTTGTALRTSDGKAYSFTFTAGSPGVPGSFSFTDNSLIPPVTSPTIDGLTLGATETSVPQTGDRFYIKPFATSATNISREFATPRSLAVASPVAASMTPTNAGSLLVGTLSATTQAGTAGAPITPYTVKFNVDPADGKMKYQVLDTATSTSLAGPTEFISGQTISYTPTPAGPGFSMVLTGAAAENDTINITQNPYAQLSGGNADAMMNLRDKSMFDGAAMTDGYAGLISQIGIRAQSANYSAEVSANIAVNTEKDRAGVSGVNLDEEAAKLLQYQQSYQASAKMIQIAQSIFDTLIQQLGH